MRTGPPAAALETLSRAPERLAVPLISAIGLALVVSAAATGQ